MRIMIVLVIVFLAASAQAQMRYAFGPKKGELVETEEMKNAEFQQQSLLQLQRIEELLKGAEANNQQLVELVKEQNRLLTTLIQFQQQQVQLQSIPLQQQGIAPPLPSAMPVP